MSYNRGMGGMGGFSMFPPVLKGLLIVNVSVFFIQHFMLNLLTIGGESIGMIFLKYFALWPINLSETLSLGEINFYPWQLISYQFLHGDFWHIFMNMFALWMFGSEFENLWGGKKFLTYYLLSGIGAAIIHMIVTPMLGGDLRPTVGASGSVYGLLLAFGLTFPDRKIFMFPLFIPVPAKIFVLIFAGLELISGFTGNDGVAHFAHLGGALTGFLLLKFGNKIPYYKNLEQQRNANVFSGSYYDNVGYQPPAQPKPTFRVHWTAPKQEEPIQNQRTNGGKIFFIDGEAIPQSTIDVILDKISAQGFQNLSEREKRILTEISKQI